MEEEIDLRPFLEVIFKRWYWIIGSGIVAGIIAFIVSSSLPAKYEAAALVAIVQSNDVVQFDSRFSEGIQTQPLTAFPELATSDELLKRVLDNTALPEVTSIEELRKYLTIQQGADKSLLHFIVTNKNPEVAANLANVWVEQFVPWANKIYSDSEDEPPFFEERLTITGENLEAAETALIEFQSINQLDTISNTLGVFNQTQRVYLQEEQDLIVLLQDAEALRTQLLATDGQNNHFAQDLTALSLQLRAFHAESTLPILLALDNTLSLEGLSRTDQLAYLESLIKVIQTRSTQVTDELGNLAPRIQSLQQQFQEFDTEYKRLLRDFQINEETYLALATKVEEERITSQSTPDNIRLVSEASIPLEPANSRKLINAIIAASLASLVAMMTILANKWWRKTE